MGVLPVVIVEGMVVGGLVPLARREKIGIIIDEGVEGGADGLEGLFEADIGVDEGEP